MSKTNLITMEGFKGLGQMTWFECEGKMLRDDLQAAIENAALPEALHVPQMTGHPALRETMGRIKSIAPGYFAKKEKNKVYAIARNPGDGVTKYPVEARVQIVADLTVAREARQYKLEFFDDLKLPASVRSQITDAWQARMETWTGADMGKWLIEAATLFHGVSLRRRGGFYFIPRHHVEDWATVVECVNALSVDDGEYHTEVIPAAKGTKEAAGAVLRALTREIADFVETTREDVENEKLGKRGAQTRSDDANALLEKLEAYKALVGPGVKELQKVIREVDNEVTSQMFASEAFAAL